MEDIGDHSSSISQLWEEYWPLKHLYTTAESSRMISKTFKIGCIWCKSHNWVLIMSGASFIILHGYYYEMCIIHLFMCNIVHIRSYYVNPYALNVSTPLHSQSVKMHQNPYMGHELIEEILSCNPVFEFSKSDHNWGRYGQKTGTKSFLLLSSKSPT